MPLSLRKIVEVSLPTFLSKRIVKVASAYKKNKRDKKRFAYGNGKPFTQKIDLLGTSFNIVLDPTKNAGVDEIIAQDGFWEKDLSLQFTKHIKEGDIFFDIGANIGYHSLFVSALLKNTGKVYAFEPLSYLCEQLHKSVEVNGFSNVEICNFGLAEKDDTQILHVREENTGGSSLFSFPEMDKFKVKETEKVILKKLDNFFDHTVKVDLIKIDVEGYEFEALKGAENILKQNLPIIFMEFSPVFYIQDYPDKSEKLMTFLKQLGYSFYRLNGQNFNFESWINEGDNIHSQIDIICKVP
jgi:FkbM family methyltransferase